MFTLVSLLCHRELLTNNHSRHRTLDIEVITQKSHVFADLALTVNLPLVNSHTAIACVTAAFKLLKIRPTFDCLDLIVVEDD